MKHSIRIFMEDCVLVEENIYFFSKNWNGLYVANPWLNKIKLISTMPEEKILARRLCAGIVHHDRKLILIPMTAKKIWIFDLKNGQWNGLERKYMPKENLPQEIFRGIEYKNSLFLIGSNYPSIIRMNLETYDLEYLTEPYTLFSSIKNRTECYFRCDFSLRNNKLYIASCLNNFVLSLDLDTFDYKWHKVGENGFCYSGIAWDGESYWLSPRKGTPIVKWDGKNKTQYFPLPEDFNNSTFNFLGVQYSSGKLIFPGMSQNKTLIINARDPHEMEINEGQYLFYKCSKENEIVFQTIDGMFQLNNSTLKKNILSVLKFKSKKKIG